MLVGTVKEIKLQEYRVGLTPQNVKDLIAKGHRVFVEYGAGEGSEYLDCQYQNVGAELKSSEEIYRNCDLIVKIKTPFESEVEKFKHGQILFTYLHLDENIPKDFSLLFANSGISSIAYEWVEDEDGSHPLLIPMSELSGILFALKGIQLLFEHKKVITGDFHRGVSPPTAVIIGGGIMGCNACNVFLKNGFKVIMFDKHPETFEKRLDKYTSSELLLRPDVLRSNEKDPLETKNLLKIVLPQADILLNCAVRRSSMLKSKCEYLVDAEMVWSMKPNSIVMDATACDKDLIETVISSPKLNYWYKKYNIIHYNCDHIPSLVSNAATQLLTEATFPYILNLANKGFEQAVLEDRKLFKGVMTYKGKFVHKYICDVKYLLYNDLNELLYEKEE